MSFRNITYGMRADIYREFQSIVHNKSEEEILAYWRANPVLKLQPMSKAWFEQFQFALNHGYTTLVTELWRANLNFFNIYTHKKAVDPHRKAVGL